MISYLNVLDYLMVYQKIVETAIKNKVHVITPNKALIAKHGDHLSKIAEKHKVNLEFEASVAGVYQS